MNRTNKITTTIETFGWDGTAWVPSERTVKVETHQSDEYEK